ncbi:MAG: hypothetical protein ABI574_06255 [Burkholderiales bacterium]
MPQRSLPVIDLAASWRNDVQALRETAAAVDAACRALPTKASATC